MWVHFTFTPCNIIASSVCCPPAFWTASWSSPVHPTSLLLLMLLILEHSALLLSHPKIFFIHDLTQALSLSEILLFFQSHLLSPSSEILQYFYLSSSTLSQCRNTFFASNSYTSILSLRVYFKFLESRQHTSQCSVSAC